MEIMNSKSSNEFRWSVRITDDPWIAIGIATKLKQVKAPIFNTQDENSIIFYPCYGNIWAGKTLVHEAICMTNFGAEYHFKFQPKMKKLFILVVSTIILTFLYLNINKKFQKDKEYAVDIKEDIDYFPVIQGAADASATLFKPQD